MKPPNINNVTTAQGRQRYSSTYGDQQRHRVQQAADERRRKGTVWRDTPSDRFDWPAALERFRQMMTEMYADE